MVSLYSNTILRQVVPYLLRWPQTYAGFKTIIALLSLLHTLSHSLIIFHHPLFFLSVSPGDKTQVIRLKTDTFAW